MANLLITLLLGLKIRKVWAINQQWTKISSTLDLFFASAVIHSRLQPSTSWERANAGSIPRSQNSERGWTFLWPGTLRPCQRPLFIETGIVSFSRSQILPIKILPAVFFTSAFSRILALWSAENLEFSWKRCIFLHFPMKTFKKTRNNLNLKWTTSAKSEAGNLIYPILID